MSDDEFDNIPDAFADIQGVDWAGLLAGQGSPPDLHSSQAPPPAAGDQTSLLHEADNSTSSSHYFSDSDEMDASFLAELNRVEERITSRNTEEHHSNAIASGSDSSSETQVVTVPDNRGNSASYQGDVMAPQPDVPPPFDQHVSHFFASDQVACSSNGATTETSNGNSGQASSIPCKRLRPEDSSVIPFPKRKGKMRADDNFTAILSSYEDELTCPICCDILVACYIGNPCGHSFCGDCGWQWHVQKKNKGCPCCRSNLDDRMPMIPNIAMDNTVEKHIKALAWNGASEWEPYGQKYIEWDARRQAWRKGAAKREAQRARQAPKPMAIGAIQVFDVPATWFELQDNLEDDPTYEDSDVELIPRPIQRARRRHRRAGRAVHIGH